MAEVDFFYDLRSPYTYFAWHRRNVLESVGASLSLRPVSIDVLLSLQAGRQPWAEYVDPLAPPKRSHLFADIPRMAKYWNIPLGGPRSFKPGSKQAMCFATALYSTGDNQSEFVDAALKALWIDAKDLEAPHVLADIESSSPINALTDAERQAALEELTANTRAAYELGVFGVPTFRYRDKIYFGADRMDVLASSISRG